MIAHEKSQHGTLYEYEDGWYNPRVIEAKTFVNGEGRSRDGEIKGSGKTSGM